MALHDVTPPRVRGARDGARRGRRGQERHFGNRLRGDWPDGEHRESIGNGRTAATPRGAQANILSRDIAVGSGEEGVGGGVLCGWAHQFRTTTMSPR